MTKPAKPKPARAKKPKGSTPEHYPLDQIFTAPDLRAVPTLEEAAALDTASEGPADDWQRLCASVRAHGIFEPLKCVQTAGSSLECYDGRSRLAAARAAGLKTAPVIFITAAQAKEVVTETLKRRHLPLYAIAYLECMKHEGQLTSAGRGRPKAIATDDAVTQTTLAKAVNCDRSTIIDCVAALRGFQSRPADREAFEPKILAGLLDPGRLPCAAGGKDSTKDQPRRPSSFDSWLPKLKSFTSTARTYHEWSERDLENAMRALDEAVKEWPRALRIVMVNTCNNCDEPAPSEVSKKKGAKA
jgi:hypothetical protein